MLQNNPALKSEISKLWDKFWSGGIANPLTAIEQITYLLFMKRIDDLELKKEQDAKFLGEPYISRFSGSWLPPEFRNLEKEEEKEKHKVDKSTLRWSEFTQITPAEDMLTHVQTRVFPFLKDMNGEKSNFTHHMKNAVFIIPKPSLLVEAVSIINTIFNIMKKDAIENNQAFQDIQGDVYEYLLSEIATAGKNGQFRTPRHIIKLVVELIKPLLGENTIDPACGSGGFLLGAYQYVITQLAKNSGEVLPEPDKDGFIRTSVAAGLDSKKQAIINDSLNGFDIDITMVRLGLMNLMMHGIDAPNIDYQDTLSKNFFQSAQYNVVMANPPFTGSIDKGDINEDFSLNTTKTELLFVEKIYQLLKKGGRAGVIIPQGVLFGAGKAFKELRKLLLERCQLEAVISMPSGIFKPYAGVSTAILVFTKLYDAKDKVVEPATEKVWFYDMQSDGYSLDDKRIELDHFGDLQDIIIKFEERHNLDIDKSDRTQKYFVVPRSEIEEQDYSLSFNTYQEDIIEEIEYQDPLVIIDNLLKTEIGELSLHELDKIQAGIVKELLELKKVII